ncbi:SDR family NAD(P)-dependent oxidoreductase [Streptomyces sp. NPDC053069]|uniref:SDR family NAD(P)-dependent oxidoreductase n=1 Tax=Streptomyces sp. NPDC053069 TaxID=3365695 RepID=UPI0037D28F46
MEIKESTALVTGANRGIGYVFARALIARGAATVYAGVRDPASVSGEDLTPLRLDVTVPEEVAAAAGDATIVINNVGVGGFTTKLLTGSFDGARQAVEINYFGTWAVSRACAPVLGTKGLSAADHRLVPAAARRSAGSVLGTSSARSQRRRIHER